MKPFRNWLYILIVITVTIIGIIVIAYCSVFNGGISYDHTTWGEFGSIFGTIAGLISFIGILLTLLQSKKMGIASEERASFFKMLEIFNDNRLRLTIPSASITDDEHFFPIREIDRNGKKKIGYDAFEQIAQECIFSFIHDIINKVPEYVDEKTLYSICIPDNILPYQQELCEGLKRGIKSIYIPYYAKKDGKNSYSCPFTSEQCYKIIAHKTIEYYIKKGQYTPLVVSLNKAADTIYSYYKNQIGIYYRNDYYLLNMVSSFLNKNNFGAIYRAQLSKDELIVLFYNGFSSQATSLTLQQYLGYDLFNNLELSDVQLTDRGSIRKEILLKLYESYETYKKSVPHK